jgi:capsular exopolysaccharide synthesis family protein
VIGLTAIVALCLAVAGLSLVKPTYQATATLQAPITTGLISAPIDTTYSDRLLNTYEQLAGQRSVRVAIARQLHQAQLPTLNVSIETNTQLLQLSASSDSAALAQRAANIAANVLVATTSALARGESQATEKAVSAQLASLNNRISATQSQLARTPPQSQGPLSQSLRGLQADYNALVQQQAQLQLTDAVQEHTLSIVQPATLPLSPSSPKKKTVLALALALGLLGGIALAFVLERFVPRLYTVGAIEGAASATVMAAIPKVTDTHAGTGIYNGGSTAQEAFGVLAIQVLAEAAAHRLRTIMVTSPAQGDGKSVVASNLASELARSGHKVLLIDADMRAPTVHSIFRLKASEGLSDLLQSEPDDRGRLSPEPFIIRLEEFPNLSVLPAGPLPPFGPARLLASHRLHSLIKTVTPGGDKPGGDADVDHYDFVVFDSPPLVVSDPLSIARFADLVLLVVGGNAVPDRDIQAASRQLRSVGAEHVSVVVNRWRGRETSYSYAYKSSD